MFHFSNVIQKNVPLGKVLEILVFTDGRILKECTSDEDKYDKAIYRIVALLTGAGFGVRVISNQSGDLLHGNDYYNSPAAALHAGVVHLNQQINLTLSNLEQEIISKSLSINDLAKANS